MLPTLNEDLIFEILSYLPVKSLVRFKSTCKPWHSMIESDVFKSRHLEKSLNKPSLVLIRHTQHKYALHLDDDEFTTYKELVQGLPRDYYGRHDSVQYMFDVVVGSCNGLVCVDIEEHDSLMIWNPSMRKSTTFSSKSTLEEDGGWPAYTFGFGFDSHRNDYKILRITDYIDVGNKKIFKIDLYSVQSSSWKSIYPHIIDSTILFHRARSLPFVNGSFHFIGEKISRGMPRVPALFMFDISSEVLHDIILPSSLMFKAPNFREINKYEESSISIIMNDSDNGIYDFWVMKEYGNQESWTKLYTINGLFETRFLDIYRVLAFRFNKGEIMVQDCRREKLFLRNSELDREIELNFSGDYRASVDTYVESLMFPMSVAREISETEK